MAIAIEEVFKKEFFLKTKLPFSQKKFLEYHALFQKQLKEVEELENVLLQKKEALKCVMNNLFNKNKLNK